MLNIELCGYILVMNNLDREMKDSLAVKGVQIIAENMSSNPGCGTIFFIFALEKVIVYFNPY